VPVIAARRRTDMHAFAAAAVHAARSLGGRQPTHPRALVITAAGEGAAVAIAINTALVRADIDATGRAPSGAAAA
jgi:hypothetical protein